jgi:hypothetical protein
MRSEVDDQSGVTSSPGPSTSVAWLLAARVVKAQEPGNAAIPDDTVLRRQPQFQVNVA